MKSIIWFEELMTCLSLVHYLDEACLKTYVVACSVLFAGVFQGGDGVESGARRVR